MYGNTHELDHAPIESTDTVHVPRAIDDIIITNQIVAPFKLHQTPPRNLKPVQYDGHPMRDARFPPFPQCEICPEMRCGDHA